MDNKINDKDIEQEKDPALDRNITDSIQVSEDATGFDQDKVVNTMKDISHTYSENKYNSEPDLKYKNKGEVAKGGILGAFIGLAVIVPGVSGSAVAIIFKMYEKLLYAIGNIFKKFKKCARLMLFD